MPVNRGKLFASALTVAALVSAGITLSHTPKSPPYVSQNVTIPTPSSEPRGTWVAYLGDSYTAGTQYGGNGSAGYPAIVAQHFGWRPYLAAVGATGYVAGGYTQDFASRVPSVIQQQPKVVIVMGSRNDQHSDPAAVQTAASNDIARIRGALPTSHIVVIGVVWPGGNPPVGAVDANTAVKEAASKVVGVSFIDALAEHWLWQDKGLIAPDYSHPTDAGHQVLALLVEFDLTKLGAQGWR